MKRLPDTTTPAARRRRRALGAVAAVAAVTGVVTGAGEEPRRGDAASARADEARAAVRRAEADPRELDRLVGRHLITRMAGTAPSPALLRRIRAGHVAGVILFGDNIATLAQVKRLTTALQRAARPRRLLILVDQEGGPVKRFAGLPPTRAPRELNAAQAAGQGERTGRALSGLGITVNLAPLADVSPGPSSFLHDRTFPSYQAACAFARGLLRGGVFPTLKHFPGLNGAPVNTDDAPVTIRRSRHALVQDAGAYHACAGPDTLTMLSNASYAALGRGPAVLQPRAYDMLRDLGGQGPTISDGLGAAALKGRRDVELRALRAGLDLLLFTTSENDAPRAHRRIVRAIRAKRLDPKVLAVSDARLSTLG